METSSTMRTILTYQNIPIVIHLLLMGEHAQLLFSMLYDLVTVPEIWI